MEVPLAQDAGSGRRAQVAGALTSLFGRGTAA
jgi:hypothetical protein